MNLKRSAISAISTKNWGFSQDLSHYTSHGFGGMGLWRDKLAHLSPPEIKHALNDHNITATNLCFAGMFTADTRQRQTQAIDDAKRALELCKELNAGFLLIVSGPMIPRQPRATMDAVRRCLGPVLRYAAEIDARIALEAIHPMDIGQWSALVTLQQVKDLVAEYRSPQLGILLDIYNSWWDPDLETIIRHSSADIFGVHLANWRQPTRSPVDRTLPGQGIIPLTAIVRLLEASGYSGFYDLEIFSEELWDSDYDVLLTHYLEWFTALEVSER